MLSGPVQISVWPNLEQQLQFFRKQRIVIFEPETEERERFNEGAAARDDFGASVRDQVQCGEFLKDSHGIRGAENGHRAGQANIFGSGSGGREDDRRRGVQKFRAVMLADAEYIEPYLVGELDLVQ